MPDCGTSGFNALRGSREIEGYLKSTQGKIKWDAIAVHPYGNIDGTRGFYDIDKETQYLIDLMKKYGYGKDTPIYFTEGFHITPLNISEWGNGDAYGSVSPSYDLGNGEYIQACLAARYYIMGLKYHPQLQQMNIWRRRFFMDQNLTPIALPKAVNTLGNLFPDPSFVSDIRPANGVRGYVFDEKGKGVAAIWCTIDRVEDGYAKGPVMRVKFTGKAPELIDLMGNVRPLNVKDGVAAIQLTPAPLFLRGDDPQALAEALKDAEVLGADTNITVNFIPTKTGSIVTDISNQTGHEQKGSLEIAGKTVEFDLAGNKNEKQTIAAGDGNSCGKMYCFKDDYTVKMKDCPPQTKPWNMHYFYVSQVNGNPDWSKIPSIPITNYHMEKGEFDKNFKAKYQIAYDTKNLYLRVECEKPELLLNKKYFTQPWYKRSLWHLDGCLEVYIDTGANGRRNQRKGYDLDDYRYDFAMGNPEGKSGPGLVWRMVDVHWQLAGGLEFPTKEEVAEKVKCQFIRTEKGFIYEITLAQRYLEPFVLNPGNMAGFGLVIHNKKDSSHLTTASEKGAHCYIRPDLWPIMILK